MTFSSEKNTPAMGALNAAEIPAAAPHATSTRSLVGPERKNLPIEEPSAEPATATGPSAPTDPPVPMASAAPAVFTVTGQKGMIPPRLAAARMTSGMFSPSESLAPYRTRSRVSTKPATTTMRIDTAAMPGSRATVESETRCAREMRL